MVYSFVPCRHSLTLMQTKTNVNSCNILLLHFLSLLFSVSFYSTSCIRLLSFFGIFLSSLTTCRLLSLSLPLSLSLSLSLYLSLAPFVAVTGTTYFLAIDLLALLYFFLSTFCFCFFFFFIIFLFSSSTTSYCFLLSLLTLSLPSYGEHRHNRHKPHTYIHTHIETYSRTNDSFSHCHCCCCCICFSLSLSNGCYYIQLYLASVLPVIPITLVSPAEFSLSFSFSFSGSFLHLFAFPSASRFISCIIWLKYTHICFYIRLEFHSRHHWWITHLLCLSFPCSIFHSFCFVFACYSIMHKYIHIVCISFKKEN